MTSYLYIVERLNYSVAKYNIRDFGKNKKNEERIWKQKWIEEVF